MDLDEELARYIAADAEGVTGWDAQPETFKTDMLLYARSAIRFFRDRMPGTVADGSAVLRASFQDIRPDDPRITELIRIIDQWEAQHGINGSSVRVSDA